MSPADGIRERRRSPRVSWHGGSSLRMSADWPVQLLDLSLGGAAWSSPHALETGRVASVRTVFGGAPFHARLRVCWSGAGDPANGVGRFIVGAAFLSLEEDSRRVLRAFLNVSS